MATLAEFRQQHPEYSNRSDMELAHALHGKYYSQIEFGTFARQIGMLDEPVVKPTADYDAMSERREREGGGPKLTQPVEYRTALEGAGKWFTDIGLGARQLSSAVNLSANANPAYYRPNQPSAPLQAEAQTKRETDAPLMETGAGKAGYVGAGVLSTLPAGAIPGAASIPGSALLGMGFGALQPTTAPGERLANTAVGGATGAAIPAALKYLPQAKGFAQSLLRPNRPPLLPEGGSVGASASAASAATASASPALRSAVTSLEGRGKPIDMEALTRKVEGDTLPVPIKITEGEATRNPDLLSNEQNHRGAGGYADFYKQRDAALKENLYALRREVGPNVFSTNPVEHGDTLIAAYRSKDAAVRNEINAAYAAAREANGGSLPMDGKGFVSAADAALKRNMKGRYVPSEIAADLAEIRESGAMDFETFENLRTNLAAESRKAERASDGNATAAIRLVRDALESIEPTGAAAQVKPLFDRARTLARTRFDALDADPAYKAAVDEAVPPDRFVQKFVVGGTRDDVAKMRAALANDPAALETMGTAAFDRLRSTAGVDAFGNGKFSQAAFNKQLEALDPKLHDLFKPETAERLRQLGRVMRTIQEEVPGSYVNRSNTFTAQAGNLAKTAAEGATNYAFHGLPVGTLGRKLLDRASIGRQFRRSIDPASGLVKPPSSGFGSVGRPPTGQP